MKEQIIDFPRLLFRRQFLLSSDKFRPNSHWSNIQLARNLYLSIHNDLPYSSVSYDDITITLIGHAIDPYHPSRTEEELLHSLFPKVSCLDSLISASKPLAGRWVYIFQNKEGTSLFTDPCGLRPVFYHYNDHNMVCASQPELIKAVRELSLINDTELEEFLCDQRYITTQSKWIGNKTIYDNCLHLMPNHYLSFDRNEQVRFYPLAPIYQTDISTVVDSASTILTGTMTALANRYKVRLALTAGWDSRVLLAASKKVSQKIDFFVYDQTDYVENHPDILVPREIAKKFYLKFEIKKPFVSDLPGWFIAMLCQNVTCARVLSKTCNIFDLLVSGENRITINGNVSETCRNVFDKECCLNLSDINTSDLVFHLFGGPAQYPHFVVNELKKWERSFNKLSKTDFDILAFLHWEQRMGNWGAQYPSEQDIAIEEISPFNCRLLMETLLSSPRHLRSQPENHIYRMLIKRMWPELLSFPINPPLRKNKIREFKKRIRPYFPSAVINTIKKYT